MRRPRMPSVGESVAQRVVNEERWSFGDSRIKLCKSWSGDIADFGWGTVIGMGCGILTGRWTRWVAKTLTESVVGVPVFVLSHVLFLVTTNLMLLNAKIITINFARLGASPMLLKRIKPVARRIDKDGDGQLTWKDLELILSNVLGRRVGQWVTGFLQKTGFDQDGDGAFTRKDVMLILAGNQHGSLGLQIGAFAGVIVGSFAPLLPFHRVGHWVLSAAHKASSHGRDGLERAWGWCKRSGTAVTVATAAGSAVGWEVARLARPRAAKPLGEAQASD